jgi:deoxyribose-phosphate aldolase
MEVAGFAKLFDHSIVRPDASRAEVAQFADTAVRLGTATLTVQPHYIQFAAERLHGSGVLVGTVVGFPHGNETASMKESQAPEVLDLGAEEIDMVMNIPALKNEEAELFIRDIEGEVRVAEGRIVKVIIENCYLTLEEKRRACEWIAEAGAQFVKTSTAYAEGGATLDDVRLMYQLVKGRCQVKAVELARQIQGRSEATGAEILGLCRAGTTRPTSVPRAGITRATVFQCCSSSGRTASIGTRGRLPAMPGFAERSRYSRMNEH